MKFLFGRESKLWFSYSVMYKIVDPVIDLDGLEITKGMKIEE